MKNELKSNEKKRLLVPILCGTLSTYVIMQPFFNSSSTSFLKLFQIGSLFSGVSVLLSCIFMPRHPFYAALFVFIGVCAGGMLDVVVHPNTQEGFERNLFPLEIMFQVVLAAPGILIVSILWKMALMALKLRKRDAEQYKQF